MHKQVKYKDFEVDEEILPIIKKLNENGLETIFSCCGLDDDGDKDKPVRELIKKNLRPYIIINANDNGLKFVRLLLLLHYKYLTNNQDNSIKIPLIEVNYDYYDNIFRFTIQGVNSCSFNIFSLFINQTMDIMGDKND